MVMPDVSPPVTSGGALREAASPRERAESLVRQWRQRKTRPSGSLPSVEGRPQAGFGHRTSLPIEFSTSMREGERRVRSPADSSRPATGCQNGVIPATLDRDSQTTLPGEDRVNEEDPLELTFAEGRGRNYSRSRIVTPRERPSPWIGQTCRGEGHLGSVTPFPRRFPGKRRSPVGLGHLLTSGGNNPRLEPSLASLSEIDHTVRYEAHRPRDLFHASRRDHGARLRVKSMLEWIFLDVGNVLLDEDPLTYLSFRRHVEAVLRAQPGSTFRDLLAACEARAAAGSRWPVSEVVVGLPGRGRVRRGLGRDRTRGPRPRSPRSRRLIPGAAAVVERLARRYRLGLIANQGPRVPRPARRARPARPLRGRRVQRGASGGSSPTPRCSGTRSTAQARPPGGCLMVGDRLDNDIAPAAALGMATAWVRWPRRAAKGWRPDDPEALAYRDSLERVAAVAAALRQTSSRRSSSTDSRPDARPPRRSSRLEGESAEPWRRDPMSSEHLLPKRASLDDRLITTLPVQRPRAIDRCSPPGLSRPWRPRRGDRRGR